MLNEEEVIKELTKYDYECGTYPENEYEGFSVYCFIFGKKSWEPEEMKKWNLAMAQWGKENV